MKKFLRLAAVGVGAIAVSLAIIALVRAGDFDGYPDNIKVWDNGKILRIRSGGELQVAAPFAWAGTSGGTNAAWTLTPGNAWTALSAGQVATFIAHTTNGSTVTLAVSGLTAKNLYESTDLSALDGGEIVEGALISVAFDGTQFQILGR